MKTTKIGVLWTLGLAMALSGRGAYGAAEEAFRVECASTLPWEKTAASELKNYLTQMASNRVIEVGGVAPATFHVGDTPFARKQGLDAAHLADEEWVIKSFGGDVVLVGGGMRGTLYAVSHFLEDDCGVRWWSETEEDVPVDKPLAWKTLNRRGKPTFLYRDIYRTEDPKVSQSRLAIRRRLNRNGDVKIPLAWGGSLTYGPPAHCHTFDRYIAWDKLGKTHPEWFSLVGGKRCGGQEYATGGQLCLSNTNVFEIVREKLLDYAVKNAEEAKKKDLPAPRMFDISMNDNRRYCECAACSNDIARRGVTAHYLSFVNRLAAELKKVRPDAYVSTLAYYFTEEPPSNGVKAAENVLVKLCNTRANMAAPFLAQGDNEIMRNLLLGWRDKAQHLFVWDYDTTYTKDSRGFPFPSEQHFAEKYRFYITNSVHGIFWEQEVPEKTDLYDLKYYLKTRLFENPFEDYPRLLQESFAEYFGAEAGRLILEARQMLVAAQARNKGRLYWFPQVNQWNFIRSEDVAKMNANWDAAEKAAAKNPVHLRRVKKNRAGFARLVQYREGVLVKTAQGWEFRPEKFSLYGKTNTVIVADAEAPTGKALELAPIKGMVSPLLVAYYDADGKIKKSHGEEVRHFSAKLKVPDTAQAYTWYSLGKATLAENGYFYMTDGWVVQLHIPRPDFNGKTFSLRILARNVNGKLRIALVTLEEAGE